MLTLAFDEQTGRAGLVTRVEAFMDLLVARRGSRLTLAGAATATETAAKQPSLSKL